MVSALLCNGSRVLTPAETTAIRSVISKPSSRALFDLLLYSGLRFAEVRQLAENPRLFDKGRGILTIRSMKPTARQAGRNVILGTKGTAAVRVPCEGIKGAGLCHLLAAEPDRLVGGCETHSSLDPACRRQPIRHHGENNPEERGVLAPLRPALIRSSGSPSRRATVRSSPFTTTST